MYCTSPRSAGLIAGTLAAFLGVAVAVPAQAAGGWSAPVPLPHLRRVTSRCGHRFRGGSSHRIGADRVGYSQCQRLHQRGRAYLDGARDTRPGL
jgi:hypothetical protein